MLTVPFELRAALAYDSKLLGGVGPDRFSYAQPFVGAFDRIAEDGGHVRLGQCRQPHYMPRSSEPGQHVAGVRPLPRF